MTTNGEPRTKRFWAFLRDNAFAITVAILAAWSSFQTSNVVLTGKVEALEKEVADHRATLKSRARFVNEATNQLNYLCHTEPTCRALYSPIAAPE